MDKIKFTNLKATPEIEDFKGKYENQGLIARKLVENYFKAVKELTKECGIVKSPYEIGAGEGYSTLRLKTFCNNLAASEYLPDLVSKAKTINPDVEFKCESVYELKDIDNSHDLVYLLEVLEHLDFPLDALNEIKRVSSRFLILGVPREPLWRVLNMTRGKYLNTLGNTPGHLNHWSTKGIIDFVEKNFGKVLKVRTPLPWTILLAKKY